MPQDPILRNLLEEEINKLLDKQAIRPFKGPSFFMSTFFLTPKKGGKWRPILNLKPLNQFIVPSHFKMDTLKVIMPYLRVGAWATSLDLADAYLHIPVHPEHRKFLTFQYKDQSMLFRALPFGLSTAPRVFTRVTRVLAAYLRRLGVQIFMYLDDWLIVAPDPATARLHTNLVLDVTQRLGWVINREKSDFVPSQTPVFLGARLDFVTGRIRPTLARIDAVQEGARLLLLNPLPTAHAWLVFLGYLASLVDIVPMCRFHMRDLQFHLLKHFNPINRDLSVQIPSHPSIEPHLQRWRVRSLLEEGVIFPPPRPSMTLTSDASLGGWGAHLDHLQVAGLWDDTWCLRHINVLELEAVRRALLHFLPYVRGRFVKVRTDNTTVVAFINRQGGTHSRQLWSLTKQMLLWCMSEGVSLYAVHLPGKLNTIADLLSRLQDAPTEWTLPPWVIHRVWQRFGVHEVDLFAALNNFQLPKFCALTPGPEVWCVDAFSIQWGDLTGYAFPPFAIIPRVLAKIESDQCQILLVAPNWPGQTWFLRLLSLLKGVPVRLPDDPNIVVLPVSRQPHPSPRGLCLTVWPLSGRVGERRAFRRTLPKWRPIADGPPHSACILRDSDCTESGVMVTRLLRIQPL